MTPQLTESWIIAYLEILITLIVFSFGIPAFIYQIIVPENIRDIIKVYMKMMLGVIFSIVLIITSFALCIVWCLHRWSSSFYEWKQLLGSYFITIALIFTLLIWCGVLVKSLRKNVVNYLEKRLYKRFRKDGSILYAEIKDLITLGERSEAGYEKEIVLKAISNLIKKIQASDRYTGRDFELILRNFDKVVASKDKPGNETDFQLAVDISENIVARLSNRNLSNSGDEILAYMVLKEIGRKSLELKLSRVVLRIVTIASSNPDALFEIGLLAFKSGDYFAALAALNKLETLALAASPMESPGVNDLLGLLAHFWTANKSSRRRAESFFNTYGSNLSSLEQYLDLAIEYHYNSARYDTADKLIFMRDELLETRQED